MNCKPIRALGALAVLIAVFIAGCTAAANSAADAQTALCAPPPYQPCYWHVETYPEKPVTGPTGRRWPLLTTDTIQADTAAAAKLIVAGACSPKLYPAGCPVRSYVITKSTEPAP